MRNSISLRSCASSGTASMRKPSVPFDRSFPSSKSGSALSRTDPEWGKKLPCFFA